MRKRDEDRKPPAKVLQHKPVFRGPWQEQLGLTEVANADRFVAALKHEVRFSKAEGWFRWDVSYWRRMSDAEALHLAGSITHRMVSVEFPDIPDLYKSRFASWCVKSRTLRGLQSMLALASGRPEIAASPDHFDANPYWLTTPSGVIDLRYMEFHEPRPILNCSLITIAPYEEDAECPEWEAYIYDRVSGDPTMAHYLQQVLGQGLIGLTGERMYFLHGPTHCGKTTILEVVRMVLGSYATVVRPEVFMVGSRGGSRDSATPTLAALRGVRFVKCSETRVGDQLDEAVVKLVTGNDRISVRRLYREPFDMKPAFTVYIATNQMPGIANRDDATAERPRVITLSANHRGSDELFADKIVAREGPGILQWLIQGAHETIVGKTVRLPKKVTESTKTYLADNDPLADWLTAHCKLDPAAESTGLRKHYVAFCKAAETTPLGDRAWSAAMVSRGLSRGRHTENGVSFRGVRLKQ